MSRFELGPLVLTSTLCVLASCAAPPKSTSSVERRDQAVELAGRLQDIADVAAAAFVGEVTELRLAGADDVQVFAAESVRNNAVSYIRSIALDDDPATALVDLYAFSRLAMWACENRTRLYADIFVEDCNGTYGVVLDRTRHLAEQWMTPEQLAQVDEAVARFKEANPDRTRIGIVRLPELARIAGTTTDSLRSASPSLFSPVTEAAEQIEQTRLLGARMLWLLSRLPEAIGWQAQAILMEALASDGFAKIGEIADTLVRAIDSLDERLDRTGESVDGLASSAAALSSDLGAVAAAADRLAVSVATVAPLAESLDRSTASLVRISGELERFEQHTSNVETALGSFSRSAADLSGSLDTLALRVAGLDESVSELERQILEVESLEGRFIDRLVWRILGMTVGVVAFAGVVLLLALRFGRR